LPLALGGDGRLDHVLVHAPMAFDERAREAIARVARVWIAPGGTTLRVELLALGLRGELAGRVPALRPAVGWASVTPFVPARHLKPRGRSALEEQVQAELSSRGLPAAVSVEVETEGGGHAPAAAFWEMWRPSMEEEGSEGRRPAARWRRFRVARREAEKRPPQMAGVGIRVRFAEPVPGPIALGYASHFGLGQLGPV
jgi:CRISPR-associated protein Csb2